MKLLLCILLVLSAAPAAAVEPDEILADAALEARARDISKELRCLVCQNQSIDDSNAKLARDLRLLVRERITKGDSNRQVIAYIVARYGDFVLLKPPFKATTWALWLGPPLVLMIGFLAVILWFRRRRSAAVEARPLSDVEQARLGALLDDGNSNNESWEGPP
jgi:cytochrome c-type biogenesis protein CcmH